MRREILKWVARFASHINKISSNITAALQQSIFSIKKNEFVKHTINNTTLKSKRIFLNT